MVPYNALWSKIALRSQIRTHICIRIRIFSEKLRKQTINDPGPHIYITIYIYIYVQIDVCIAIAVLIAFMGSLMPPIHGHGHGDAPEHEFRCTD